MRETSRGILLAVVALILFAAPAWAADDFHLTKDWGTEGPRAALNGPSGDVIYFALDLDALGSGSDIRVTGPHVDKSRTEDWDAGSIPLVGEIQSLSITLRYESVTRPTSNAWHLAYRTGATWPSIGTLTVGSDHSDEFSVAPELIDLVNAGGSKSLLLAIQTYPGSNAQVDLRGVEVRGTIVKPVAPLTVNVRSAHLRPAAQCGEKARGARVTVTGELELPENCTYEDLEGDVEVAIQVGDWEGSDTLTCRIWRGHVWLYSGPRFDATGTRVLATSLLAHWGHRDEARAHFILTMEAVGEISAADKVTLTVSLPKTTGEVTSGSAGADLTVAKSKKRRRHKRR